jgi:uncharacterized protein YjbJ (UPF0337 family)
MARARRRSTTEGTGDRIAGRVLEVIGKLTGKRSARAAGKATRARGHARATKGRAKRRTTRGRR